MRFFASIVLALFSLMAMAQPGIPTNALYEGCDTTTNETRWIKIDNGIQCGCFTMQDTINARIPCDNIIQGTCIQKPTECRESQEWTYGIDNTGTTPNESFTYQLTLSNGQVITWTQSDFGASNLWTPQTAEWETNIQAAADAAGIIWFVTTRFRDPSNCANLAGGGGFPGPPSEAVSCGLTNMLWRYINIQICPGQPVPVAAEIIASSNPIYIGRNLSTDGAILGPEQKWQVCTQCGEEDQWYKRDGTELIPALAGEIPNCWFPCGTLSQTEAPPESECEFDTYLYCDNVNSTDDADWVEIFVRVANCNGIQTIDYFVEDNQALVTYNNNELVGDLVDCDTGEEIAIAEPCEEMVTWYQKDGYICDEADSRFAEAVCWVEGVNDCGDIIFPDGATCPTYLPGKYDSTPTVQGKCNSLSLGSAATSLTDENYGIFTTGNTHGIKFTQNAPTYVNLANKIINNTNSTQWQICRITIGSHFWVYDPATTILTGGNAGSGSISFESTKGSVSGCQSEYDAIWNQQADGNGSNRGWAEQCTQLTFTSSGPPIPADCALPLDPQPTLVSKEKPEEEPACQETEVADLFEMTNKTQGFLKKEWNTPGLLTSGDVDAAIAHYKALAGVAPNSTTVITANIAQLADVNAVADETTTQEQEGWICLSEPILIRHIANSEGSVIAYIGECGGDYSEMYRLSKATVGLIPSAAYSLPIGTHKIKLVNVDNGGINSVWQPQVSNDGGLNWTTTTNILDQYSSSTQPIELCKKVEKCTDDGTFRDFLTGAPVNVTNCYYKSMACTPVKKNDSCELECSIEPSTIINTFNGN